MSDITTTQETRTLAIALKWLRRAKSVCVYHSHFGYIPVTKGTAAEMLKDTTKNGFLVRFREDHGAMYVYNK